MDSKLQIKAGEEYLLGGFNVTIFEVSDYEIIFMNTRFPTARVKHHPETVRQWLEDGTLVKDENSTL